MNVPQENTEICCKFHNIYIFHWAYFFWVYVLCFLKSLSASNFSHEANFLTNYELKCFYTGNWQFLFLCLYKDALCTCTLFILTYSVQKLQSSTKQTEKQHTFSWKILSASREKSFCFWSARVGENNSNKVGKKIMTTEARYLFCKRKMHPSFKCFCCELHKTLTRNSQKMKDGLILWETDDHCTHVKIYL